MNSIQLGLKQLTCRWFNEKLVFADVVHKGMAHVLHLKAFLTPRCRRWRGSISHGEAQAQDWFQDTPRMAAQHRTWTFWDRWLLVIYCCMNDIICLLIVISLTKEVDTMMLWRSWSHGDKELTMKTCTPSKGGQQTYRNLTEEWIVPKNGHGCGVKQNVPDFMDPAPKQVWVDIGRSMVGKNSLHPQD